MQVNRLDRHMSESMAGMAGDSKVTNVSSSLQNSYASNFQFGDFLIQFMVQSVSVYTAGSHE